MSYEYDASYRLGLQRSADLAREVELKRRAAERAPKRVHTVGELPTKLPSWVWFHKRSTPWDRFRPASAL